MFTKDEMKRKYQKKFDRQKNFQAIIRHEEKKKLFVTKLAATMAGIVFVTGLTFSLWNKGKDEKLSYDTAHQEIGPQIVLNINVSDDLAMDAVPALRADMKMKSEESHTSFDFLSQLCPKGFDASVLNLFTIVNRESGEASTAFYHMTFYKEEATIDLTFSLTGWPFRCYYLSYEHEVSILDGVEMDISSQIENELYLALFQINDMYFDVETKGITENELVDFLLNLIEAAGESK